jgi:hypothetical protein
MGYVTGPFHWVFANVWALVVGGFANVWALVVGGFVGHLFGDKIAALIAGTWRKIGG